MTDAVDIVVIGGGRWGRVVAGALAQVTAPDRTITVCTTRCRAAVDEWAVTHGLQRRIRLAAALPPAAAGGLAVVVNAAHDHERALDDALSAGYHVVAEKPFTLSYAATRRIHARAVSMGRLCMAANVLQFTGHLPAFARLLDAAGGADSLEIQWSDPAHEVRHGAVKRHDPRLPVMVDIVPHVVAMLATLRPGVALEPAQASPDRGGDSVTLSIDCGGIAVCAVLERNSDRRRRTVVAMTPRGRATLDFAEEPATFTAPSGDRYPEPGWTPSPTPMQSLLGAALAAVDGNMDPRLGMAVAFESARITESLMKEVHA